MIINHYITPHKQTVWYGLKCLGCPDAVAKQVERSQIQADLFGCLSEHQFEIDCFLSVLADIKKPSVRMVELGAGWGEWCLALAGAIRNGIIPGIKEYYAIALEGDPAFAYAATRNFENNEIDGRVIHGAISDRNGMSHFNCGGISRKYCGGGLSFKGNFGGSAIAAKTLGAYHALTHKTQLVETYTLDFLRITYGRFDIVHMDVQGAEILALTGAINCLLNGDIDYWIIGTHGKQIHKQAKEILEPYYEFAVDFPGSGVHRRNGNKPVYIADHQDGMLVCKRKELNQ